MHNGESHGAAMDGERAALRNALLVALAHLTFAAAVGLALPGCRSVPTSAEGARTASAEKASPREMVRTELYFGLDRKDGPDVSAAEWSAFVDDVITPRFPDGFTVLDARGQWRGEDGTLVREPSRIVVILRFADGESDVKVDQIRLEYVRRFQQDAVMRVDTPTRAYF